MLVGHKVIEVRTRGVHKGMIVPPLVEAGEGDWTILAMGDDRSDEDLFAALPPESFAVHVGPGESQASYRLANPTAVRAFLTQLLQTKTKPRKQHLFGANGQA
jgi:trehalose 6-phosphate synthase/phosphatase